MNDVTMKSSIVGGGNPLNIIRIVCETKHNDIIYNSNLGENIVPTKSWNLEVVGINPYILLTDNTNSTAFTFDELWYLTYGDSGRRGYRDKNSTMDTYPANGSVYRPIIEFKE